jgi:hypothetical protein
MGVSVKARCAAIPFCLSGLPPREGSSSKISESEKNRASFQEYDTG